ncbi:MAG TPA: pyrroloquinoline quinone biosynthesis peptide chaperone PqqD [Solirubrobacterales bacterium]|jgi:pyrroloquinoline quinone biosynthesis protein D|nr:pyrroloquinoline quinone biosynthesis peptide chaperone PqqD [Solirubrobacterales bacterium]
MALERPKLATGVRLHRDKVREQDVLLFPEGALVLNDTAVEVLQLCDGERSLDDIAAVLGERYEGADVRDDVAELLAGIGERGLVIDADA